MAFETPKLPRNLALRAILGALLLVLAQFHLANQALAQSTMSGPRAIALDVRVVGDENASRIIIDFDRTVEAVPQLLEHPWRLVLDFDRIGFTFDPKPDTWSGFARDVRWGDMSEVNSRIIFEMEKPFKIIEMDSIDNPQTQTQRLVIDVETTDPEQFRAAMFDRMRTSAVVRSADKSDRLGAEQGTIQRKDRFIVVIDAGHGGIDSGAVGHKGILEKHLTLAFAKSLKAELDKFSGVEAVLSREDDVFISLSGRVRFARERGASLFISLHADSVRERNVRGATVYTISERASDRVAAQLAESENKSDAIAGLTFDDEPDNVSNILIDLARRETLGFSVQFARLAVDAIGQVTNMIKNPHRHAGFRVLRAPDVPSVLIELGFMSNRQDEELLTDPAWREKTAAQIARSVVRFAELSGHTVEIGGAQP